MPIREPERAILVILRQCGASTGEQLERFVQGAATTVLEMERAGDVFRWSGDRWGLFPEPQAATA